MQKVLVLLFASVLSLAACGGDDNGESNENGGNNGDAPVLDSIGDRNVDPDSTLTINLSASDPNGDGLSYSYIVLSNNSPFNPPSGMQASWTTGTNTASFSWTPTIADDGEYQVRFVVTDNSASAFSDQEDVTITVTGPITLGRNLYEASNSCASCHGSGNNTEKRCALAADIQDAINNNDGGMGSAQYGFTSWSAEDVSNVSAYLVYIGELVLGAGSCG